MVVRRLHGQPFDLVHRPLFARLAILFRLLQVLRPLFRALQMPRVYLGPQLLRTPRLGEQEHRLQRVIRAGLTHP